MVTLISITLEFLEWSYCNRQFCKLTRTILTAEQSATLTEMELVFEFLFSFVWWIVLFPVIWLLSAPFIVLLSVFDERPYRYSVRSRFNAVTQTWADWGIVIVP